MNSRSPIYDALLLAHIICAIGGFGANGLAGLFAGQLRPTPSEQAVKYFSSPKFMAERLLYLVPVFGLLMIAVSHGLSELQRPWIIVGIIAWLAAIGVAHSLVWPNERRISAMLTSDAEQSQMSIAARRLSRGALIMDLIFLVAFVTMFVQFGGR